ncbi:two-component system sensor histidine kinase NtrB [Candidatus Protochlamydia amoebophila]|uniref:histidine kinase n=1 Tax=Candidatus Protochlamydia amoebophila TaxID=362787 RepID=A0A0C1JKT2_9BACT|nr:ATP-binding protein [Candidatus Protochlamydia amoebophila]KIC71171.1 Signal transduction histidine-protein kinase AtoS [Candidatus Protochlamydia amoebophila]
MAERSEFKMEEKEDVRLEQAFKQFSLETERLEFAYQSLQEQFKGVQKSLQESHTKHSGKLAELDFVTRYLETILNHISQGILFVDLNGIITTCNTKTEEILKVQASRLLFHSFSDCFEDMAFGFSIQEVLQTKTCPRICFVTRALENDLKVELEIEPTFVSMSEHSFPLDHRQPSSPPVQGLLILIRNITEVRRLQQAANQYSRLKELGEMAAHLAHEIRNPLGGIKGFATLLQQDLADRPELQQMAYHIIEGTDSLNHFVSNILTYTRPFQARFEHVNLKTYLEEIGLLLQADVSWNASFSFNLNTHLPDLVLSIDPPLLKSAILNLLVNAMQAMPQGGKITVSVEKMQDEVIIIISDTGIGISKENLNKIFSPFFTTKETGTGLGLAEVQKVIQAHQGTIEVKSEVGNGTSFTIKLPLKVVQ